MNPLGPTGREKQILRRIGSRGGLRPVFRKTRLWFYFADDTPAVEINSGLFHKFESLGWVVPDPSEPGLFQDALAQTYQPARKFWP